METDRQFDNEALVGSVFADRYRLTRLLSSGANTVLFDADDLESQRPVTIKVVQPGLAVSASFRDRFDQVVRDVAALSHPNIAAIYDWGVARLGPDPTGYVVTERLTAGSLRDLYDRGRRLSPSQALAIGLEACRGLDHAHRRGLVHGELTPSKLVFGDDRRLRIVDFGLASLLGERQWDEPSSLSTHVARYASPEQALSLPVDGTTDVYALCLTLVEGVTGELPFAADSTVATLAARVGKLMPVSADLGPLASVLERAGRPEAHERYSAAQFGRALVQTAEKLPRPEPLPLLATGLFETPPERLRDPNDPTGGVERSEPADLRIVLSDELAGPAPVAATAEGTEPEPDPAPVGPAPDPGPSVDAGPAAELMDGPAPAEVESGDDALVDLGPMAGADPGSPGTGPSGPVDIVVLDVDDPVPSGAVPTTLSPVVPSAVADGPDEVPGNLVPAQVIVAGSPPTGVESGSEPGAADRRRRGGTIAVVVVPLLVLVALVAAVVVAVQVFSTPSYDVPDLVGTEQNAALLEIADFEWDLQIDTERSDDEPRAGHVVRTVPPAGERLARGEPFLLVVSDGPVLRVLPELTDLNVVDAVTRLDELALVPVTSERFDEVVPSGRVIEWSVVGAPELVAGGEVEPGTEIDVVASLGPEPRVVADFVGAQLGVVVTTLAQQGLVLAIPDEAFDDEVPAGSVISQDPEPGTEVERGSEVSVVISLGPDVVPVPDVIGLEFTEAFRVLAEAGLEAVLLFGASDAEVVELSVDGAAVAPGTLLRRGTEVGLTAL